MNIQNTYKMKSTQLLHPFLWSLRISGFSLAAVILLYSCKDGSATTGFGAMPPPSLPVITAKALPATTYQDFTASVQGKRDVEIRPQVDGYLTGIEVDEGAYVHKGQALFLIDRRLFEEQLNSAKANLQATRASMENGQINVDKLKPLVENNVVSGVQLKSAQATYNSAKAAVDQAQSAVESARINLNYTAISAPSDGYVGTIPYKTGSLVTKGMAGALTIVSETRDMRVYFSMSEPEFLQFKQKYPGSTIADKVKEMPPVQLVAELTQKEMSEGINSNLQ
jgi:membrane fusion protein, multidrug efflux system